MTTDRAREMVLASFVGDSLSLAPHWIYDTDKIKAQFGQINDLLAPLPDGYNPRKKRGDLTHLGDQTLLLLQSLARYEGTFNLTDFAEQWVALFSNTDYPGYRDHATKVTLAQIEAQGKLLPEGSDSNELGAAARLAPLIACYHHRDDLIHVAIEQTRFTHGHPASSFAATWIAAVAQSVLAGANPLEALRHALASPTICENDLALAKRIAAAIDLPMTDDPTAIVRSLGQSCPAEKTLPASAYLITRFSSDLRGALIANVMAGGDSAARGLVVGMIVGAHTGIESVIDWIDALNTKDEIEAALVRCQSRGLSA